MSTRYPDDPGDALYMQDGADHWYVSPDIWLNTPGGSEAVANQTNTVFVVVRKHPEAPLSADTVEVEVFVANPSLGMQQPPDPDNPVSTKRIGFATTPRIDPQTHAELVSKQLQITWHVPAVDPARPQAPDQPGHRCLIARVYPLEGTKPGDFQVIADQHEAQRNITIVSTANFGPVIAGVGGGMTGTERGEPLGPGEDGLWRFGFDTVAPVPGQADRVRLRVTWTPELPGRLVEEIAGTLRERRFRAFAAAPPTAFSVDLGEGATVLDQRPPSGDEPSYEADVELEPDRVVPCELRVDLRDTAPGEAHVLDLEQIGSAGDSQGGLTLLLLKVD